MNKTFKFAVIFCFIGFVFLLAFYLTDYRGFLKGRQLLGKGLYESAKKEFTQFLSQKPDVFSARLNIAFLESLQKNKEQSLKEYSSVFKNSPSARERFEAYFNSAVLHAKDGELSDSLYFYQKALEEEPDSLEVKTNIELMMSQNKASAEKQSSNNSKKQQSKEQNPSSLKNNNKENPPSSHEKKQQENTSPRSDGWKQQKDLKPNQVDFILKELEKQEMEIKKRLQKSDAEKTKKGSKQW